MELFNEIFTKQTLSWKEFFRIVYGEGLTENGTFQLHDFTLYSEKARQEFILKLSENDIDVLDDYLKNVYMAILIGAQFISDNRFEEKPREVLLGELLLWAKWGVDPLRLPIYQVAFALIYYFGLDICGYELESYQVYNEEYRAEVIRGLCVTGNTNVLEAFLLNSRNEININCDWYTKKWKRIGVPRHLALLSELSNWCNWGAADFAPVITELFSLLLEYVDKQDCEGFSDAFEIVKDYLTLDMRQNLWQIILQMNFCNEDCRECFKTAVGGYVT